MKLIVRALVPLFILAKPRFRVHPRLSGFTIGFGERANGPSRLLPQRAIRATYSDGTILHSRRSSCQHLAKLSDFVIQTVRSFTWRGNVQVLLAVIVGLF